MSIYGLPGSRMYWNSTTRVDCVADTMTMHRWEAIKRNIHFADNTQLIPRGEPGHDQLHKVRPLLTSLLESFQAIPIDERLCVDEQIVPFKGKSGLKQYKPRKQKRWGYKMYVLSDSNGIAYNFQVHTGPIFPMDGMPDIGASGNIVLRLASIIPGNQSHKLFFDNWFTSVDLQTILQKKKIHCVATVRHNRLAGCSFSDDKVMKKKGRDLAEKKRRGSASSVPSTPVRQDHTDHWPVWVEKKGRCKYLGSSDELNISIHSFPTDVKRQRTWEKNVQNTRAKWSVKNPRTTYICSAHFLPDDFEEGPILMVGSGIDVTRKRILKPSAVPTLFPTPSQIRQDTGDFATATPAAKRHRSAYFEKREKTQAEGRDLVLGGDGRADSPGHCAKFGSYTMLELHANVVVDVQLVQSNECGGSYHMEKTGLERSLAHLERQGLAVGTMVTDRHRQIAKWLRETYPHIEHLYDIWHVAKGFSKKLLAASNERECQVLRPWIKSVSNHMYWCAVSTPSGQGAQIVAKWESVVSHVQNVHTGHGDLFPSCIHGRLEGRESHKKWLEPSSKAAVKLETLVCNKTLVLESPTYEYAQELLAEVVKECTDKENVEAEFAVEPVIVPPPLCAEFSHPEKADFVKQHLSRFKKIN
ncbi:hypothetical protein JOQ06_002338 [Pogonophryne albipinna]|uniref:THAP-type domain-containing protein n=1 Tax=Pogonophryne albipinna TaxID=1090488 RepID=A0AAD6B7L2_9TELE|nr:hypothetical protein JOQ06_002338 [Pogonophryne albipinna]